MIDLDDILVTMLSYWLVQEGLDPATDVEWVTRHRHPPGARRAPRGPGATWRSATGSTSTTLRSEGYSLLLDVHGEVPERPARPRDRGDRARHRGAPRADRRAFVKAMIRAYWFVRTKENFAVTQAMERRLRRDSPDEDERARMAAVRLGRAQAEMMPFPIDGLPTGLRPVPRRGGGPRQHRRAPSTPAEIVEARLRQGGVRRARQRGQSSQADLETNEGGRGPDRILTEQRRASASAP